MVRGAVTGPFSLACALAGTEEVLVATVEEPRFVRALLEFAARTAVDFGAAFLERGVEPVLFDSKASPAAASPRVFREFVLPVYRDLLVPALREAGARTDPARHRRRHDADPRGPHRDRGRPAPLRRRIGPGPLRPGDAGKRRRALRASVDARLVHRGAPDEIRRVAARLLEATAGQPGLLFGCGVVAYDCDPANVLALREARDAFSRT